MSALREAPNAFKRAQRSAAIQRHIGNTRMAAMLGGGVRGKIAVGEPGDRYEREADEAADHVVSQQKVKPISRIIAGSLSGPINREMPKETVDEESNFQQLSKHEANTGGETAVTVKPLVQRVENQQADEGDDKQDLVQTSQSAPNFVAHATIPMRSGNPLPQPTRAFFEPRFGVDLSRVRVHSDKLAAQTARSVSARAFTLGNDIVFADREFQPELQTGKYLLAHELAHVIQQREGRDGASYLQKKPDELEGKVPYPIEVPRGIKTIQDMHRYAEVIIFGRVLGGNWHFIGGKPNQDISKLLKPGRTFNYWYFPQQVEQLGGKKPGKATRPASTNPDYSAARGKERDLVNQEIDRRYWEKTKTKTGEKIKRGEQAKIDMWNVYRDEVMSDRKKLKELPKELVSHKFS
jgi:hypothetical protein